MILRCILIPLILLSACAMDVYAPVPVRGVNYAVTRAATLAAWHEVVGSVTLECYAFMDSYIVVEVDVIECGTKIPPPDKRFVGCAKHSIQEIQILSGRSNKQKAKTAVHEYVHVLARCEWGHGDSEHVHPLLWDEFGDLTVEVVGCDYLSLD